MLNLYKPRRASKRWLECAPEWVLSIHDAGEKHPNDRYDVFLCGDHYAPAPYSEAWVSYYCVSESGAIYCGEMNAADCAAYRYRSKRIRWIDLPLHVRACVMAREKRDRAFAEIAA